MALFKKTTKEKSAPRTKTSVAKTDEKLLAQAETLVRPHITEKAALLAEKGTYVFEVSPKVNKKEIASIVRAKHKVNPVRVNIINLPRTRVMVRGKAGVKSGVRKALVTLAKGEKIELI